MPQGEFSTRLFSRPNRRPVVSVWTVRSSASYLVSANVGSTTDGIFSASIKANVPTWIGSPTNVIGQIWNANGTQIRFFNGASPDVQYAFENYDNGVVLASQLRVKAYPVTSWAPPSERGDGSILETGVNYNPEAQVSVTLTRDPFLSHLVAPPQGATEFIAANKAGVFRRAFQTSVRYTRGEYGARPQGAYCTATYTPHDMSYKPMADLLDNLDDYKFNTNEDATHEPVQPTIAAYWNIVVASRPTGILTGTTPPAVVGGIALPHRLSLSATYRVMFYSGSDIAAGSNAPLAADQSATTQGTTTSGPQANVFDHVINTGRDVLRTMHSMKRPRTDGGDMIGF